MDDSDLKKYRLTAATMVKFMIRARRQRDPNFITKAQWGRWWNTPEPSRPASARVLLEQVLKYRDRLTEITPLDSHAAGERDKPTVFELVDGFINVKVVTAAIKNLKQNEDAEIDWERLAEWTDLQRIRDELDRLPGDKSGTRKKGGRPCISAKEAADRIKLVEDWHRARDTGESKTEFCKYRGIELTELDRALDWYAKRRAR